MRDKTILVTGASGYIAGLLIPRLLEAGHPVRAMVREKEKIAYRNWRSGVSVVKADVIDPESLTSALEGVHTAYYLVHNMASGPGYLRVEKEGAKNFARSAGRAGTHHIIYLGGLADPDDDIAPHLRSRIDTGIILREHPVPVTEFRAGVIAGPGSISFEMIRYICEQFPLLIGPAWLKNCSQPVSADNVIDYLVAALDNPDCRNQVFEIGGPEVYTYAEIMLLYAKLRGLNRWMLLVPFLPTALMAWMVGRLSPVPKSIAHQLIEGLSNDSVVKNPQALEVFPGIRPTGYRQAVHDSLEKLHPKQLARIWIRGTRDIPCMKSEGFFVACLHAPVNPRFEVVREGLVSFVKNQMKEYQIESDDGDTLLLAAEKKTTGKSWLEWEIVQENNAGMFLRQTGFYAPRGLPGFLARWGWHSEHRRIFQEIRNYLR